MPLIRDFISRVSKARKSQIRRARRVIQARKNQGAKVRKARRRESTKGTKARQARDLANSKIYRWNDEVVVNLLIILYSYIHI